MTAYECKTEISLKELTDAYAPLWDASKMLETSSDRLFGELKRMLERAQAPLLKLITKIEEENPDQFG